MSLNVADSSGVALSDKLASTADGVFRAGLAIALFVWLPFLLLLRLQTSLHVWVGVPLALYACYLIGARRLPGPTPVDFWAGALILLSAVSVIFAADPRISTEVALSRAAAVVAFYLAFDARVIGTYLLWRAFVTAGLVVSLFALLNVTLQYLSWLDMVEAVKGSLSTSDLVPPTVPRTMNIVGHANSLAKYLNLLLPLAVMLAFSPRATGDRWLAGATVALGSLAMFFTLSRAGWVGLTASAFVLAVLLFLPRDTLRLRVVAFLKARARWFGAAFAVAMAGVLGLIAVLVTLKPVWLFRATLDDRFDAIGVALAITEDNWLIGAGPGSYATLYDLYKGGASSLYPHAHNLYASTLSEIGLLGSLVVILGGIAVFRALVAAWRRPSGQQGLIAAVIAGLAANLVQGLADLPTGWNTQLIPFAILLGVALRDAPPPDAAPSVSLRSLQSPTTTSFALKLAPRLVVFALLPAIIYVWIDFDRARSEYESSLPHFALESSPQELTSAAVRAADLDPDLWLHQMHAGVSVIEFGLDSPEDARKPQLLDGVAFLERARRLAPDNSLVYANLAMALRLMGDRDGAVAAARDATRHEPLNPAVYAVSASTFEWAGLHAEAVESYATAIDLDPSLIQSPFWLSKPQSLRAEVIAVSQIEGCDLARYAALYGVYTEDLPALAATCREDFADSGTLERRADLAMALVVLGKEPEALALVNGVSGAGRRNRDMRLALALVMARSDPQQALHELLMAHRVGSTDARALLVSFYTLPPDNSYGIHTPIPGSGAGLPEPLVPLARSVAEGEVTVEGAAQRGASVDYIGFSAFRSAPPTVIIPGDWVDLLSPRTIIGVHAYRDHAPAGED